MAATNLFCIMVCKYYGVQILWCAIIMVCKYVVHINRLLSSRKVGTTKLALVSDSLVSKSLVSNVLFQGEFVVSCKRALVTGVQNFS